MHGSVGTVTVRLVGLAAVTVADTPSMVTVLLAGVALNPVPLIVAVAPLVSVAGETDVTSTSVFVDVAVNTIGLTPRPVTLALNVLVPRLEPMVQDVTAATPSLPLVGVPPLTLPPPEVTVNVTCVPDTAFPSASVTFTEGGIGTLVFGSAAWLSPASLAIAAAGPTVVVTLAVTDVKPAAENVSVRWPIVPEIERLVNVAVPVAVVLTVVTPPSVPPPAVMLAVTATFAEATGFEFASCSCTIGDVEKTARFATEALGAVVSASLDAGPAVPVAVNVTGVRL